MAKAVAGGPGVTQNIAWTVKDGVASCSINGTVVGSFDKATLLGEGKLASTNERVCSAYPEQWRCDDATDARSRITVELSTAGEQAEIIREIREAFAQADCFLRVGPALPVTAFRNVLDIGPIAEPAAPQPIRLRAAIGAAPCAWRRAISRQTRSAVTPTESRRAGSQGFSAGA